MALPACVRVSRDQIHNSGLIILASGEGGGVVHKILLFTGLLLACDVGVLQPQLMHMLLHDVTAVCYSLTVVSH